MGPVLGPVFSFIGAIFFGAAAGASAAYVLAVNIARVALLSLAARLTAPKIDLTEAAFEKLLTIRDPVAPQSFVYGQDMLSGPLIFANTAGTDNRDLYRLVALTGREVDSFVAYRVDDTDIVVGVDIAGETGTVTGGKFEDVLTIDRQLGTAAQTVISALDSAFTGWTSNHRCRGWSTVMMKMMLITGRENAFEEGVPQNLRVLMNGHKLYDPRKYALNADPDFATIGQSVRPTLKWWGNDAQTSLALQGVDSFAVAAGVLTIEDNDDASENIFSERFPVDTAKLYTVRVDAAQLAGDRKHFLGVAFYDAGGANILGSTSDATGWVSKGAYHYFHQNAVFAGVTTEYSLDFGVGGTASIPTGAVTMALTMLLTRDGAVGTDTTIELSDAAIFEGATRHEVDDTTTWEWSDNPALCLADFWMWENVGLGEPASRIDWARCITAAQICDQLVDIPGSTTQKRYSCNFTFFGNQERGQVKEIIETAMLGRSVFSQGKWKMWAGAAIEADVTLTEANLAGGIQLQASAGAAERYNRVRGKFVDPTRNYTANTYPEQRSAAFETADGEVRYNVADFNAANTSYEAQRAAIITLLKSRNQRILVFEGNLSCFRVQPGTVVEIDIAELGFNGEKFFVSETTLVKETVGVNLTLVQETDTVWDDPDTGEYTVRTATGALIFGNSGVPAPTSLTAASRMNGVQLNWTNPPEGLYRTIEVWASNDNDRSNASKIIETSGAEYFENLIDNFRNRYYWIRARSRLGTVSDWEPSSSTAGVTNNPLMPAVGVLVDSDFDHSTALGVPNDGLDFFWAQETTDSSGIPFPASAITFQAGAGANSSNSVKLLKGIPPNAPTTSTGLLYSTRRFRCNIPTFTIKIRWRNNGANTFSNLIIGCSGFSAPQGGSAIIGAFTTVNLAVTGTTWQTATYNVSATPDDVAQFWELRIRWTDSSANQAEEVEIDSVFVIPT